MSHPDPTKCECGYFLQGRVFEGDGRRWHADCWARELETRLARVGEEKERLAWRVAALETAESHRLAEVRADLDRLRKAAQAAADWWLAENAKTRSFGVWFGEILPELRAALSQTGETG